MASTPVEVYYDPGKTLTADFYPRGSDTVAASSVSLTEATNRDGVYTGTVVSNLSGYYTVHVIENSRTRAIYDVYMLDDTATKYAQTVGDALMYLYNITVVTTMASNVVTIKGKTDQLAFGTANRVNTQVYGMQNDVITAAAYDESTAYPLKSADTGSTQVMRAGADSDTGKTISDQIDGLNNFDPATETVDVGKINGSTTAATNLQYLNDAAIALTVDNATFTPTTTVFETDGTITADDTLIGMAGTWFNSGGTPANTGTYFIEDSEGTTTNVNNKLKITTETMPAAPANGDVFVILGSKVR